MQDAKEEGNSGFDKFRAVTSRMAEEEEKLSAIHKNYNTQSSNLQQQQLASFSSEGLQKKATIRSSQVV